MSIILLVEDEIKQSALLKKSLLSGISNIKIIQAYNSKDAFEYATKYPIDLFIFDIGLPDKNGLKLAEELRKLQQYKITRIIFITAFPQYLPNAVKKVHCYDYIVKPYNNKDVITLVDDILKNKIVLKKDSPEEYFSVIAKSVMYSISIRDILFIDVNQRECNIHTYTNTYTIKRLGLRECLQKLPSMNFKQCYKSTIVNIDYINSIEKTEENWEISLLNYQIKLIVGNKYKTDLFNAIRLKNNTEGAINEG